MTFKRILVATDFEDGSRSAVETAVMLGRTFGASVTVVHAYEFPVYTVPYSIPTGPVMPAAELSLAAEQNAAKRLDEFVRGYSQPGLELDGMLRSGEPWREIVGAAEEIGADLVVMGTHGRRGLPRALLGSVAEKVVRMSPVPVLIARRANPEQVEKQ